MSGAGLASARERLSLRLLDKIAICYLIRKSPRKVYSIDTGLANTVGFRFSGNWGRAAENAVFIELKRRAETVPGMELFYWKNERHQEVDFIIRE